MDDKYTYDVDKTDNKVKISIKITSDYFKEEKETIFKKLSKGIKVSGFRPGKAPRNVLEAKLGPTLYEETINSLFPKVTSEIVEKEKLKPISKVDYHLEKVADGEGLAFHVEFEAYPEVNLPDFKKLKVKKEKAEVNKKEIEQVIEDMFKNSQNSSSAAKASGDKKGNNEDQDEKEKKKGGVESKKEKVKNKKEEEESEEKKSDKPDDKWVESLKIDGVKTLKDLEKKVREQVEMQKNARVEEQYLVSLIDKAIEKAAIIAPETLVNRELENREKSYKARIEKLGLKFDDFMKSKKTNPGELKKEWEPEIKKKISREILLIEIARANNLKVTKEEIDKELAMITDPSLKQQYETDIGKQYIATVIIQQKATRWVKEQAEK